MIDNNTSSNDSYAQLARELRQRAEALGRSGLDRIPCPPIGEIEMPALPKRAANPGLHLISEASGSETPLPLPPEAKRDQQATARQLASAAIPNPIPAGSLLEPPAFDEPPVPPEQRLARLEVIATEVAACTKCPILVSSRSRTVFGTGNPSPRLMFIGEAPGADEDRLGVPFIGRAGALLTDMITKGMGLAREEVYIANAIKCRPPENRTPETDEIGNCRGYLERQIAIVRPEFLCLLGRVAVASILQTSMPMNRLRLRWYRYKGIPTVVTYHPSYLLRMPSAKRDTWEDLKMLMQAMELKPPTTSEEG